MLASIIALSFGLMD
ncbi:uncharacterized protein FFE2_16085 [Fusarium fujikuroi]|nr:uncharacterized protein FFE2_16041 [Fusarium fujikuroi]SCO25101.1 uncharacterized protein FFE2_16085 [Fusarium fujikuroi]SCO26095.1 uncharacterized protein FFC1_15845 [Fusarium fujikuroi]